MVKLFSRHFGCIGIGLVFVLQDGSLYVNASLKQ